jgi:hypothetical protein
VSLLLLDSRKISNLSTFCSNSVHRYLLSFPKVTILPSLSSKFYSSSLSTTMLKIEEESKDSKVKGKPNRFEESELEK